MLKLNYNTPLNPVAHGICFQNRRVQSRKAWAPAQRQPGCAGQEAYAVHGRLPRSTPPPNTASQHAQQKRRFHRRPPRKSHSEAPQQRGRRLQNQLKGLTDLREDRWGPLHPDHSFK